MERIIEPNQKLIGNSSTARGTYIAEHNDWEDDLINDGGGNDLTIIRFHILLTLIHRVLCASDMPWCRLLPLYFGKIMSNFIILNSLN